MKNEIDICYLCGEKLNSDDIGRDHVPMRQIYATGIRKAHNLNNLLTLRTHTSCNRSYQDDEDYFVVTLAPLAIESYSGAAVLDDATNLSKRPQRRWLVHKVLGEFGKIILPNGWVTKGFEGDRISRILWKVVRGLFFYETGRFLPENTPKFLRIFSDKSDFFQEPSPLFFRYIVSRPSKGQYPVVFDYKYNCFSVNDKPHLWLWGIMFWDTIICEMNFPDPESSVEECRKVFRNLNQN